MTQPRREVLQKLTPVLTKRWLSPDAWKIDTYERLDGYAAVRKALDTYLFLEKVQIASRLGALHEIALHGPGAAASPGTRASARALPASGR